MQSGSDNIGRVREGDILAGKYRIEKILGTGGMGVVVAAHHIDLDDKVAIKFLLPEATRSPEAVARFAREARAAVKIKNEHVARVSDVSTLETGAPYMVMEYLEGGDLGQWIEQRGALPVEQAVEFILQACEAIAEAHALGIVHRDLKPANLFVITRADGSLSVKVLDFGISKLTGTGASGPDMNMTKTSTMMGSPLYMSPEQMESAKNADARSDIWALGAILYELVAGVPPFNGETLPEVFTRILQHQPPPLANYRADVPPGFEAVVLRCLEKNRESRFQNVAELARALVGFGPARGQASAERISKVMLGAGIATSALPAPEQPPAQLAQSAPAGTVANWGNTANPTQSGGGGGGAIIVVAAVGALVVLLAIGAGVLALVLHRGSGHVAAAASAASAVPATAAPSASVAAPAVASVASPTVHPAASSSAAPPAASSAAAPASAPAKSPAKPVVVAAKHAPAHKRVVARKPAVKRAPVTKPKPKSPSLNSLIDNRQ